MILNKKVYGMKKGEEPYVCKQSVLASNPFCNISRENIEWKV